MRVTCFAEMTGVETKKFGVVSLIQISNFDF